MALPLFCLKLSFGSGGEFHLQSKSFIGPRLPWKFEPNRSWLNFCLIWGTPFFLPKIEFWLRGGGRLSTLITIFYWSEVTLKFWAKSKLVEFLPNLGCSPPFLPKIKFWLKGGGRFSPRITIFCWSKVTLKCWAKSEFVEFLPNLGCSLPFFA